MNKSPISLHNCHSTKTLIPAISHPLDSRKEEIRVHCLPSPVHLSFLSHHHNGSVLLWAFLQWIKKVKNHYVQDVGCKADGQDIPSNLAPTTALWQWLHRGGHCHGERLHRLWASLALFHPDGILQELQCYTIVILTVTPWSTNSREGSVHPKMQWTPPFPQNAKSWTFSRKYGVFPLQWCCLQCQAKWQTYIFFTSDNVTEEIWAWRKMMTAFRTEVKFSTLRSRPWGNTEYRPLMHNSAAPEQCHLDETPSYAFRENGLSPQHLPPLCLYHNSWNSFTGSILLFHHKDQTLHLAAFTTTKAFRRKTLLESAGTRATINGNLTTQLWLPLTWHIQQNCSVHTNSITTWLNTTWYSAE
jgi:hypothetical protein